MNYNKDLIIREGRKGRPVGQIAGMTGAPCRSVIAVLERHGIQPVKAKFDPVQAAQDALREWREAEQRRAA